MKKTMTNTKRLLLLDEYRGLLLINMILYHAIWDFVYLFGHNDFTWFSSGLAHIWQQFICWSFIFLSGFCWQMSKQPLKRGAMVFGSGLLITVGTILVMPSSRILFGVLTLIGSSMLFLVILHPVLQKIPPIAGSIGSFLFFLFLYPINRGYLRFLDNAYIELPSKWYANLFTTFLGFPEAGFFSTDYFSILPWFFLFVTGYFVYSFVAPKENITAALRASICPPLGWIGRHSLLVYILHQPIVYAVLLFLHQI